MLVRAHGFAIQRGVAEHVVVELDVRAGLPAFALIGLAAGAARDARERVQAAVLNSGLSVPRKRVTVNLAPAGRSRNGSEFDLAIACCVVAAEGAIDPARLVRVGLFAELGLGGLLRPCAGAAAAAGAAGEARLELLIVSRADVDDAHGARAVAVAGARDLAGVVSRLSEPPAPHPRRRVKGAGRPASPPARPAAPPAGHLPQATAPAAPAALRAPRAAEPAARAAAPASGRAAAAARLGSPAAPAPAAAAGAAAVSPPPGVIGAGPAGDVDGVSGGASERRARRFQPARARPP